MKKKLLFKKFIIFILVSFSSFAHEQSNHSGKESNQQEVEKKDSKGKDADGYLSKMQKRYRLSLPFFSIPTFYIPVIRGGKLLYRIDMYLEFKAKNVEGYRKATQNIIYLIDGIFCDLYVAFQHLWIPPEPPSIKALKERILSICHKILGQDFIEDIYVQKLTVQSFIRTNRNASLKTHQANEHQNQ
jgi:hypothetical protein